MLLDVLEFCRLSEAPSLSRGGRRLEDAVGDLNSLCVSFYGKSGPIDSTLVEKGLAPTRAAATHAKDVTADRVALRAPGPLCDPRLHLKGEQKRVYEDYENVTLPMSDWPDPLPRKCHKISPTEELKLARAILRCGMGSLVPESLAFRDQRGRVVSAGWFGVDHKQHVVRLIQDRRPANAIERRLGWAELPGGEQLAQLVLGNDEEVRSSLDDLRTYFFDLARPIEASPKNLVGRRLRGEDLPDHGGQAGELYYLSLDVWGMGDSNSVDIAQQCHVSVLQNENCLNDFEPLERSMSVPKGRTWEGVYIDDHLVLQKVKQHELDVESLRDDEILAACAQGWVKASLRRAPEKEVRFSLGFIAWGAHVESTRGLVGINIEKRRRLSHLTQEVTKHGYVNRHLMQMLLGNFVPAFSYRRELVSVWHRAYQFVESLPESGAWSRIPPDIRDEMVAAAGLLSLASAHIRWPVSPELSATDATTSFFGATVAPVGGKVARALFRVGEHRGEHTRLDWADT